MYVVAAGRGKMLRLPELWALIQSRRRRLWTAIAIAVGILLVAGLAVAGVIRITTDRGELIVEVDDPDVDVRISQDGREVAILKEGAFRVSVLPSGYYQVEVLGESESFEIDHRGIRITRGAKRIVTIRRKKDSPRSTSTAPQLARPAKIARPDPTRLTYSAT